MLPFSKRANGLFQIPMNIDTSIGKYLPKFIGKNHLFIIPLIEFCGVAECFDATAVCAKRPLGFCPVQLCMEVIIIKSKFKPILFLIVTNNIETREEAARTLYTFIACIKHIDKPCDRIYFAGIPCRYIKKATALFPKLIEALKFIG